MKVRALSENSALISAISNDLPIENMFVFQLQMFAKQGDLVVLLSAGGNSQNIKKAAAYCQDNNIFSIGLIGGIKPDLGNCFNLELHINSVNLQIVEDIHEIIGHIVFEKIKKLGNE
jgi:D-sedoheptulose 7-phosphate isomerase